MKKFRITILRAALTLPLLIAALTGAQADELLARLVQLVQQKAGHVVLDEAYCDAFALSRGSARQKLIIDAGGLFSERRVPSMTHKFIVLEPPNRGALLISEGDKTQVGFLLDKDGRISRAMIATKVKDTFTWKPWSNRDGDINVKLRKEVEWWKNQENDIRGDEDVP